MILKSWEEFKYIVNLKNMNVQFIESSSRYVLSALDGVFRVDYIMAKGIPPTSDQIDFENNYKNNSNKTIGLNIDDSPPFASKKIGEKKLYSRVTGEVFPVTTGSNNLEFEITYDEIKFNGIEIINTEIGEKVNLLILDDDEGSVSGTPNSELNEFGFSVNMKDGFYVRESNYDADFFSGMKIKLEYESISNKNLYVNYLIHELKE